MEKIEIDLESIVTETAYGENAEIKIESLYANFYEIEKKA